MFARTPAATFSLTTPYGRRLSFHSKKIKTYEHKTMKLLRQILKAKNTIFKVWLGLWKKWRPCCCQDDFLFRFCTNIRGFFVSVWQCAWLLKIIILIDNFSSGFAVGTFVAGIISDMFGRKRCTYKTNWRITFDVIC